MQRPNVVMRYYRSRVLPDITSIDVRFTTVSDRDADTALTLLSADERARHDRFMSADDRRAFAIAHALLRVTLSEHAAMSPRDWTFDATPSGKPVLDPSHGVALSFSLSHTRGLVACAVADGVDVGIDVESHGRAMDADALAARFFASAETAYIRSAVDVVDVSRRFITFWTLKEAYVKALGVGLSYPLDDVVFSVAADEAVEARVAGRRLAGWHFTHVEAEPGFSLGLAVRARGPVDVQLRRANPLNTT